MNSYRKYPSSPPSKRGILILVLIVAALLLANLIHQTL